MLDNAAKHTVQIVLLPPFIHLDAISIVNYSTHVSVTSCGYLCNKR
jgi:hypothetical protein